MSAQRLPQGHQTDTPAEVPGDGWWEIAKRVRLALTHNHFSMIAAGVAFYAMLSIFPALAALVSLYGLVDSPAHVQREIVELQALLPGEASGLISEQLESIIHSAHSELDLGLLIGFAISLWSARSGTVALMIGLDFAYKQEETRGFLWFQTTAIALTIGAILFGIAALVLIALLPMMVDFLPLDHQWKTAILLVRWPILACLLAICLSAMYRLAPCRREKWRWLSWGGVVATLLWIVGSSLFSLYVSKFAGYEKTFGSLGAVAILLIWLYLSAYVVLLGATLNAEIAAGSLAIRR